jgi:hypothetical protein
VPAVRPRRPLAPGAAVPSASCLPSRRQPPAASRHTAQVGVSPATPRAQTPPHSNATPRARTLTAQAPAQNAGRQQGARLGSRARRLARSSTHAPPRSHVPALATPQRVRAAAQRPPCGLLLPTAAMPSSFLKNVQGKEHLRKSLPPEHEPDGPTVPRTPLSDRTSGPAHAAAA